LDVYLIDFGLARPEEGTRTQTSGFTPGFAPLEYIIHGKLSKSSDVYGLGATLICLLTQTRSGQRRSLMGKNSSFNFKKKLKYKLNPRFISWLSKMVAASDERYSNAQEALKQLPPISPPTKEVLPKVVLGKLVPKRLPVGAIIGVAALVLVPYSIYKFPAWKLQITNQCQECRLSWTNWEGANLGGANLQNANLLNAKIEGVSFAGANLRGVTMPDGTKR